jgi:protein ImuB
VSIVCALAVSPAPCPRALWNAALDALDAASPLIEDAGEGIAYLEMRGIEGAAEARIARVRRAVAALPLTLRVAYGPNKFVARAAALAEDGRVCTEEAAAALLLPLPLRILGLSSQNIERLELLGIRTLGELAALPHGPFVRRFGPKAARWHALARGDDPVPLRPRPRALRIERALSGEGSAEREDQLLFALRALVARVAEDLAAVGRRCGRLGLQLECEDGEVLTIPVGLARPSAQAATLFDVVRARLDGLTLRSPVCRLRLGADHLEEAGTPLALFAAADPEALALAVARLQAAFGERAALRARLVEGRRPEACFAYEPFAGALAGAPDAALAGDGAADAPVLQYRLLEPRLVAVVVKDGAPAFVGTPPRRVVKVAGPWRYDETWWRSALRRDDYDVVLEGGTIFRLTRTGGVWHLAGYYD